MIGRSLTTPLRFIVLYINDVEQRPEAADVWAEHGGDNTGVPEGQYRWSHTVEGGITRCAPDFLSVIVPGL